MEHEVHVNQLGTTFRAKVAFVVPAWSVLAVYASYYLLQLPELVACSVQLTHVQD